MKSFAETALPLLRELPAPLSALLLQQARRYEVMFPPERQQLERTLNNLRSPRSPTAEEAVKSFRNLRIPPGLSLPNWEIEPSGYAEAFTAAMWSSDQIAAFRHAAQLMVPPESDVSSNAARAVVVVLDASLRSQEGTPELFQRLRPAGALYTQANGTAEQVQQWMRTRALVKQGAYAHWVISGGLSSTWRVPDSVVKVAYGDLKPARLQLLERMNHARYEGTSGGPEGLRSAMLATRGPDTVVQQANDPVLQAFATDVLVAGSGTQLYSTTFVQWSVREALRRARPQTIVAHFLPRNASASMDVRLSNPQAEPPLDSAGSLVDAEMHTYMTYINLSRLPAAKPASFLVWHQGYQQALLIGPGAAAGTAHAERKSLSELLAQMTLIVSL